jgi:hypothetical protein
MRLFNILVMDQIVRGTGEVFSSSDFNEVLGRASDLVYEVEVEDAGGTSPTISVRHLMSNSGKDKFVGLANLINGDSLATLPYRNIKAQVGPLAGLGQVGVTLGGASPWARVRIWATGRSN